jgi:nucleotide-binding universal stress UspA family protein
VTVVMQRILVAVDDTGPSLRAAGLAVVLAAATGGRVRALNVFADGVLTELVAVAVGEPVEEARRVAGSSVLAAVIRAAERAGVPVGVCERDGEPGPEIVADAREWAADLVVLGRPRSVPGGSGGGGDVAVHVVEFADVPVLLVP